MSRTLDDEFRRFLGRLPVWVALAVSAAAGAASVLLLRSRDWGRVDILDWSARGGFGAVVAALGFVVIAIVADRTIRFPAEINVTWPHAFVVYPLVAVIAEVVFHLVPLAALTVVLGLRFEGDAGPAAIVCMVVVALAETVYQVVASQRSGARRSLVGFVAVHLAVLGFAQMVLLWRFGVAAMFLFRFVYYAGWHVIWGRLRLAP